MAQQLNLNNGNIFTVTDIVWDRQYADFAAGSAFGLAASAPPASFVDLSTYINDDWEPEILVDRPYGVIHNLKYLQAKSVAQPYIDWALNNGAFVWGSIYTGGMYICKRDTTNYNIYMFCGCGVPVNDDTQIKFYLHDYATTQNLTLSQIKWVTILHTIYQAGDVDVYNVYYGGDWQYNPPATYQITGTENYENPLDLSQVTSVTYSGRQIMADMDILTNNQQIIVNPIGGADNFQTPKYMYTQYVDDAVDPDTYTIYVSQEIGERGYADDPDYVQQGSWWGGDSNKVKPDANNGSTNTTGGGFGNPSKYSDSCGGTDANQYNSDGTTAGFFTIFAPSESDMLAFNNWLMTKMLNPDNIWDSIWTNVKKVFAQPTELILAAGAIKHSPREKTQSTEIKFCGVGTEIFTKTAYQYQEIDFGHIEIEEQYKSYLDYNGFSEISIFLPFIGIRQLEQNDLMGATLSLKYQIDNLTGSCIAQLKVTRSDRLHLSESDDGTIDSYLYTFDGTCMEQLPITATDWQNAYSKVLDIAGQAVSSIATGNAAGLASAAGSAASGAVDMKPTIKHTSTISGAYGMMDGLRPYLILKRPIRAIPAKLGEFTGYRCSKSTYIGECSGFTKVFDAANLVKDIHAPNNGITATDAEKQEIASLLMNGIIV